jgi:hypothetical protein
MMPLQHLINASLSAHKGRHAVALGERLTLNKIYVGYYSIGMALAPRISYQNGRQNCIYIIDGEGARREALHSFAV